MNSIRFAEKPLARRAVVRFLLAALFAGALAPAIAADYGVESANPADRPTTMSPDLANRSSAPGRPPAYGPEDAPVLILIFSDYQCPACRRSTQATHQISAEFPGDVRIEVWQNPLAMHKNAEIAAIAAIAAQNQGRFWEMHDVIFQNYGNISQTTLEEWAQALGLDMERFRADMKDPAVKERIGRESALANALGAPATPGWSINGKISQGWGSWRGFRSSVASEVNAARKLVDQGLSVDEIREQRALDNLTDSESFELYRSNVLAPEYGSE